MWFSAIKMNIERWDKCKSWAHIIFVWNRTSSARRTSPSWNYRDWQSLDNHLSENDKKNKIWLFWSWKFNLCVLFRELWMTTYIFFKNGAFLAVVGIRDTGSAAYHASSLVWTVVAFIADTNQSAWSHVRIANNALSIVFFAQTTNGCNKIRIIHKNMKYTKANVLWRFPFFTQKIFVFDFNLPTPGCLRQKIKSGWCFAMFNQ